MATATEMIPTLGQIILARFEQIGVECEVVDVRSSYGRIQLQIRPTDGTGCQWIDKQRASRVTTR